MLTRTTVAIGLVSSHLLYEDIQQLTTEGHIVGRVDFQVPRTFRLSGAKN